MFAYMPVIVHSVRLFKTILGNMHTPRQGAERVVQVQQSVLAGVKAMEARVGSKIECQWRCF